MLQKLLEAMGWWCQHSLTPCRSKECYSQWSEVVRNEKVKGNSSTHKENAAKYASSISKRPKRTPRAKKKTVPIKAVKSPGIYPLVKGEGKSLELVVYGVP